MKLIVLLPLLAILFFVNAITYGFIEQKPNEQNEEARKKLLEKEERDIELDGNE